MIVRFQLTLLCLINIIFLYVFTHVYLKQTTINSLNSDSSISQIGSQFSPAQYQ